MKAKSLLVSILIGIVGFPTIVLGGSFVSSLIDGKTIDEAVQILAEQIDSLIGRIEIIETKQAGQEQFIQELQIILEKEQIQQEAYREFRKAFDKVWLYGKGKGEEATIQVTREYCQRAIEEGNEAKVDNFCPLADELESTWNIYQNSLK